MRILLDLIPLKSGGGQQVGTSLISELEAQRGLGHEWITLATYGSGVARSLGNATFPTELYLVPAPALGRAAFERLRLKEVVAKTKPDIIFSQFGTGLPPLGVPAVVGSAYSNLYYPELDFWGNWPLFRRTLYRIRDRFRLERTLAADGWIFETDEIARRAIAQFALPAERVAVVRPSPSAVVQPGVRHSETRRRVDALAPGFRVLLLTGWHKNKSLDLLPAIAHHLVEEHRCSSVRFVVTVAPDHPYSQRLLSEAERLGVSSHFDLIGAVPPEGCAELYEACDTVLLLSLLESFSNNIIESWVMERPLVITDADWSRAVCGDAAEYADRTNPRDVARTIARLAASADRRRELVTAGGRMRQAYPSPSEKLQQAVTFLARICQMGVKGGRA